ncbi:MAG TPA: TatD family hydrolase [Patescibacteria group bacterium]|nr:TatD family hydrolase [Patescibacteria group bacterium]
MVDAHCHLNLHAFDEDYDAVAKRAFDNGVKIIINTGTSIPSSRKAVEFARQYEQMYAIVGVHPHHADKVDIEFEGELQSDWFEKLHEIAKEDKVIGIGEIGMDYFMYKSNGVVDKKIQEDTFRQQIELSIELGLPLQIHNRLAGEDTIRILRDYKSKFLDTPGMFHCFAGTFEVLHDALDLGFYIGFDVNTTYKGIAPGETVALSDLAKAVPIDRMMTETDSPFLSPIPLRGTRNEPANVIIVGKFLADLKGVSYDEFSETIDDNARQLFKINF